MKRVKIRVLEDCPSYTEPVPDPIRTPEPVAAIVQSIVLREQREVFLAFLLNTRHQIKSIKVISIGSLCASIVHPREVFRTAVMEATAGIILAHNHPSGDPSPSEDDLEITQRLRRCGEIRGVEVLDHVIAGSEGKLFSFRESGLI